MKPRTGIIIPCAFCRKDVYVQPKNINQQNHYCSYKCMGEAKKTGTLLHCERCQKEFYRSKSAIKWSETRNNKNKYCSQKCYNEDNIGKQSGENNPHWKGGKSRGYKTGYYSIEYKKWREAVFKRDNYKCQECGDYGYINAHHIKGFTHYPELRYEISNGVTLCRKCHKTKHAEILKNRKGMFQKKQYYHCGERSY